jgi:hypothetical protein
VFPSNAARLSGATETGRPGSIGADANAGHPDGAEFEFQSVRECWPHPREQRTDAQIRTASWCTRSSISKPEGVNRKP